MTQIIRLSQNMQGNFSNKDIVTPIGKKPIFTFNANRTKMSDNLGPLPSDYGELSYSPKMELVKNPEAEGIEPVSSIKNGFYGKYLELYRRGYKASVVTPTFENLKIATVIKFQITSPESAGSSNRLITFGLSGLRFIYIRPTDNGKLEISTSFSAKKFLLINENIVNSVVTLAIVINGDKTIFTVNGITTHTVSLDEMGQGSLSSLYLNANDSLARFHRIEIFGFDVYSAENFSDKDLIILWKSIN